MLKRNNSRWIGALVIALGAAVYAPAQTWRQVGPPGGTVISLEADPHDANKLYLGTSDGHVFTSNDEGAHWQLLSRIGTSQDDVIANILIDAQDSNRLYASTWTPYSCGGGVYRSDDAGRTWQVIGLEHETVRALAQASSNPKILVAGSLSGVYRSMDEGANWERITPANHDDLKNFASVAFDPRDENIIYAGTHHLPWKTTNGGKDWFPIGNGMIDDSDVSSIVIDPANPESVYATASSGVYHSVNAAQNWTKYKGIPFVFRRTQLIRQDPLHSDTLYAGTTSGLWKTTNEGAEWTRVTPGDWVIHAIVIDPKNPQHLIMGTEREGVQMSENGGTTFASANVGFHHQHIQDFAMDPDRPERALVVLTFDTQEFLATGDGGTTWYPLGAGLKRTDLRHVYAAPTGWWASLTSGGWMKYEETSGRWVKKGLFLADEDSTSAAKPAPKGRRAATIHSAPKTKAPQFNAFQVNDMVFAGNAWFAATTGGVVISKDRGATWKSASKDSFVKQPAQSLESSADGSQVWAIVQRNLLYSADGGEHWEAKELTFADAGNLRLHRLDDSNLFITSNMGLYASRDAGKSWNRTEVPGLQFQDVARAGSALVVSLQKHGLLASFDAGKSWQHIHDPLAEGYFPVVHARRNGALVAASATEGLLALESDARSASGGVGSPQINPASNAAQKPQH